MLAYLTICITTMHIYGMIIESDIFSENCICFSFDLIVFDIAQLTQLYSSFDRTKGIWTKYVVVWKGT